MNTVVIALIQIIIILLTTLYGMYVFKILNRPEYKDEDSSVFFSASVIPSFFFALFGLVTLIQIPISGLQVIGFSKDSTPLDWKGISALSCSITLFLTYTFCYLQKKIRDLKSNAYRQGFTDAKESFNHLEILDKNTDLKDYDEEASQVALLKAFENIQAEVEEERQLHGEKSKEQILEELEAYWKELKALNNRRGFKE